MAPPFTGPTSVSRDTYEALGRRSTVTFNELAGAHLHGGWTGDLADRVAVMVSPDDPDYNPLNDERISQLEPAEQERFKDSGSALQTTIMLQSEQRKKLAKNIIEREGLTPRGILAGLVGGVPDIAAMSLGATAVGAAIPAVGEAIEAAQATVAPVEGAGFLKSNMLRLGRAGITAGEVGAAEVGLQGFRKIIDPDRTMGQAAENVVGGMIMAGGLHFAGSAVKDAAISSWHGLQKPVGEAGARIFGILADPESDVARKVFEDGSYNLTNAPYLPEATQAPRGSLVSKIFRKNSLLGSVNDRVTTWSSYAKQEASRLFNSTVVLTDANFKRQGAESLPDLAKAHYARLEKDVLGPMLDNWRAWQKDAKELGISPGTRSQFEDTAFNYLVDGVTAETPGVNKHALRTAEIFRTDRARWKDVLVKAGMLDEAAETEVMRLWNVKKVNNESDAFRDRIRQSVHEQLQLNSPEEIVTQAQVDDELTGIIDGITQSRGYGPLRSRSIEIPDSVTKDYQIKDLGFLSNVYYRKMAPKLELVKRFADLSKFEGFESEIKSLREAAGLEGADHAAIAERVNAISKAQYEAAQSYIGNMLPYVKSLAESGDGEIPELPAQSLLRFIKDAHENRVKLAQKQALKNIRSIGQKGGADLAAAARASKENLRGLAAEQLAREPAKRGMIESERQLTVDGLNMLDAEIQRFRSMAKSLKMEDAEAFKVYQKEADKIFEALSPNAGELSVGKAGPDGVSIKTADEAFAERMKSLNEGRQTGELTDEAQMNLAMLEGARKAQKPLSAFTKELSDLSTRMSRLKDLEKLEKNIEDTDLLVRVYGEKASAMADRAAIKSRVKADIEGERTGLDLKIKAMKESRNTVADQIRALAGERTTALKIERMEAALKAMKRAEATAAMGGQRAWAPVGTDYDNQIQVAYHAGDQKLQAALRAEKNLAFKDHDADVKTFTGNFGGPSGSLDRLIDRAVKWAVFGKMGKVVFNQTADYGTLGAHVGVDRVGKFLSAAAKDRAFDPLGDLALEDIRRVAGALESQTHEEQMRIGQAGTRYLEERSQSWLEDWAQRSFGKVTLFDWFTEKYKGVAGPTISDKILEIAQKYARGEKLSELEGADMSMLHLHENELLNLGKRNVIVKNDMRLPDYQSWGDNELTDRFNAAVRKLTEAATNEPLTGARPRWMTETSTGRALALFKGFLFGSKEATTSRFEQALVAGHSKEKAAASAALTSMILLGSLQYIMKEKSNGREPNFKGKDFAFSALDNSGILSLFMEINNTAEKVTGATGYPSGIRPMFGIDTPGGNRFISRSATGALFGPVADSISTDLPAVLSGISQAVQGGGINGHAVASAIKLTPLNNAYFMTGLPYDFADLVGNMTGAFDLPNEPRKYIPKKLGKGKKAGLR